MNERDSTKRWLVGILFVTGLGLLLGLTFLTQRISIFSSTTSLHAYFTSARGLEEGNPVIVMGVRKGAVRSTELVPPNRVPGDRTDHRVRVKMTLNGSSEQLRSSLDGSYRIMIRSASMLGGSQVSIERVAPETPGGTPLRFPGPNYGESRAGGLEQVSDWLSENREDLTRTVRSFREAADAIKSVARGIQDGEGTLGKLMTDRTLYNRLEQIANNTKNITEQIRSGDGVLGRLVRDEKMGKNLETTLSELQSATTTFRKVAEDVRSGKGVMGSLLRDEKLAENLKATLEDIRNASSNIRSISEKLNTGRGTLGKLITEDQIGKDLETFLSEMKKASRSIRDTAEKINRGQGSLGKFINEDEFYSEAKKTVEGLSKLTSPVRRMKTFVGLDTRYFAGTEHFIHRAYLRVHTDANKFLQVGASAFDLSSPETDFRFEDGVKKGDDQLLTRADAQLGTKFYDGQWTIRAGLIEGRIGAGTDYEFYVPFLDRSVKLTLEGRSAYSDLEDEDLDEDIDRGLLLRSGVSTTFLNYGRISAGVSRIGSDPEGFVGLGFEYEDQDIRNFFSLLGLAN